MKLEHLISTMHQDNFDFVNNMNCSEDILIINQSDTEDILYKQNEDKTIKIISTKERGLSNSRNMLLKNATGEICIIGDDDLIYADNYYEKIQQAYINYPKADIIIFSFTQDLNKITRRQFKKAKKLNIFNISKIASVEITFKLNSIKNAGLKFDTLLGLGAKYGACEENAFLADVLRAGLKIWYVPETICYLKPDPPERVKWQHGFDKNYFIKRGACFYRIYKSSFLFFSICFLLIKKLTVFKNISIIQALKWMIDGKKEYIKDITV